MNELQNELHQIAYDYLKYEAEYNQDHEITANVISERSAKKITDHYAPIIADYEKQLKSMASDNDGLSLQITDLQKKVAELEAANEWVRAEDRLPECENRTVGKISHPVLFETKGQKEHVWIGYYDEVGQCFQAQGFSTFKVLDVTVWRYLFKTSMH